MRSPGYTDGPMGGLTLPTDSGEARAKRSVWFRRSFLGLLVVFVALGAANVYGVRTTTVAASGEDYSIEVRYASVSRPGLATPWSVEIRKPGGFDGPVTLATTSSFFDLFDENGLDPDPSAATTDDERVLWEFEPPEEGDGMVVSFDARIEPAVQLKWLDVTTELIVDGEVIASVDYRTFVMP